MKHGSLFSGIGGFDLAAEWMGWENVFHCEWNPFGQKILNYYWPNAKSYGDIDETDFTIWRGRIDVLSEGFPYQPYSTAGTRKGKEDNRHKWPQMLRAVREIQPGWIVGENVRGIIDWNGGMVFDEVQADLETEGYEVLPFLLPACAKSAPHRRDRVWFIAYSNVAKQGNNFGTNGSEKGNLRRGEAGDVSEQLFSNGVTTNSQRFGQQGQGRSEGSISTKTKGNWEASWTYPNDRWPTEQPLRRGDDGLSKELYQESLTAYGNAIVPQVAYEIFKAIEECKK